MSTAQTRISAQAQTAVWRTIYPLAPLSSLTACKAAGSQSKALMTSGTFFSRSAACVAGKMARLAKQRQPCTIAEDRAVH